MKTQPILDSVLAHLASRLPDVSVELFPDDAVRYFLAHPVGAVLIAYRGSDYETSQDVYWVNQKRGIELVFTVVNRSQWGDAGSLQTLDLVREAIVGFEAINCKKASIHKEGFLEHVKGLWLYEMSVILPTQNVQHDSAEKV